jgi:cytochrome c oxidase subunit 2
MKITRPLVVLFSVLSTIAGVWLAVAETQPATIEILCRKSFYTPAEIRVKKGVTTELLVRAEDVTHGFAIDDLGVAREIAPGEPVRIRITPTRAGQYPFYCVVRCGVNHLKMRGTLIVTD